MQTLLLAVAALATCSAVAADPGHPVKPIKAAKAAFLICPVTGEKIASIKDAAGHSTYKGKTYYFCCPMCKPLFDKDPAKYVHNAAIGKYGTM